MSFYKDFFAGEAKKNKEPIDKYEIRNLYKRPPKEKKAEMGNYDIAFEPNIIHQADLLFLPNDEGFCILIQ